MELIENQKSQNLFTEFKQLYKLAYSADLVETQKEFAQIIGCRRETVAAALNGNPAYLTLNLIKKARLALLERGISLDTPTPTPAAARPQPTDPISVLSKAVDTLTQAQENSKHYADILERAQDENENTIQHLRETVDRLLGMLEEKADKGGEKNTLASIG